MAEAFHICIYMHHTITKYFFCVKNRFPLKDFKLLPLLYFCEKYFNFYPNIKQYQNINLIITFILLWHKNIYSSYGYNIINCMPTYGNVCATMKIHVFVFVYFRDYMCMKTNRKA